ncbi:MAG: hypothetical protein JOZ37_07305 [Actinobacteria bacterium]|nr:hypothetical protein [Actinomycetota bacterium]MBV9935726.1 hypothetical protein [Actinomycetota bacterium]
MNWRARLISIGAVVGVSMMALMWPLHAAPIDPPIPPIPPPPEQVQPALEVIAPVVSPECGNAAFATALVPTAEAMVPLPGGFPVNVLPVFGPVLVVCGSVPLPGQRLQCSPDKAASDALNQVTGAAAGTPVPADTRVVGPIVQETFVVQDALPPPANTAGLAEQASGTLTCTNLDAKTAPPPETPPAEASEPPPSDASGFTADQGANVEGFTTGPGVPDLSAAAPSGPVQQIIAQSQQPIVTASTVSGPGFAYPVILVLPLLLIALGGYLGWALTRPVGSAQR